jgi:hypothetical protein
LSGGRADFRYLIVTSQMGGLFDEAQVMASIECAGGAK